MADNSASIPLRHTYTKYTGYTGAVHVILYVSFDPKEEIDKAAFIWEVNVEPRHKKFLDYGYRVLATKTEVIGNGWTELTGVTWFYYRPRKSVETKAQKKSPPLLRFDLGASTGLEARERLIAIAKDEWQKHRHRYSVLWAINIVQRAVDEGILPPTAIDFANYLPRDQIVKLPLKEIWPLLLAALAP